MSESVESMDQPSQTAATEKINEEQKPEQDRNEKTQEQKMEPAPEVNSENAATPKCVKADPDDEDLEDGEIDDDDENDEPVMANDAKPANAALIIAAAPVGLGVGKPGRPSPMRNVDAHNEPAKKQKSKKNQAVDDDFAGAIQSAIAAALKKDGIMPPKPKLSENREDIEKHSDKDSLVSKSSRRRKRRKMREDRERDKDRKKHRTSSPDTTHLPPHGHPPDDDLDDDEMLCVRGGSPPPGGFMPTHPSLLDPDLPTKKEGYDSDESYSSYDSYDSSHNYGRYTSSRKKDQGSGSRSKRKERGNRRDDDRRADKRSRRNYDDSGGEDKYQDRHPQQPRKLELCKFYLMECCAKKDKCSYMHSDFPCKYYYLGMECVYRSACKFSHGKPLTDQLRSVLLKHLETAPKEILGTFRRISRENALNLMNATHERICAEHGVENTLAPPTMTTQSVVQSQAGCIRNADLPPQHLQMQQQLHQQQLQAGQNEIIPSLLDMVINIPPTTSDSQSASTAAAAAAISAAANMKSDKQRKSRWCDTPMLNTVPSKQSNLEPPSINAPSYLDLKNLTGILSADRIEKLSQFGVVNLEQINQLTLSQLNNIGLTINEISEIQLNARNMARIGMGSDAPNASAPSTLSATQDVDMRFLPSCLPLTTTTATTSTVTSEKQISDINLSSPDPVPLSAGMGGMITAAATNQQQTGATCSGGIDYSQYLRDSNLGYDKNDLLDDEKDEEQLVIDDQDLDALDDNSPSMDSAAKEESENDSKGSTSYPYGGADSNDARLPRPILLSDSLQNLLKDPTNLYTVNVSAMLKSGETSKSDGEKSKSIASPFEDNFYGSSSSASSSRRRDTDNRDEYRDPRLSDNRDDFHDPRRHDKREDPRLSARSSTAPWRPSPSHYRSNNSDDDSDESRSQSPSQAPPQAENSPVSYERQSMYDWTPRSVQEDTESNRSTKADKDMRLSRFVDSSNSDIDLRLPFQPVKNIQIAKEIDGSMSTLMPIPYKIYEIAVPDPKYNDLRESFQGEDSTDPRIRRILGLPELSNSKVLAALSRSSRPTIASPSSVESASSPTREREKPSAAAASPAPSARGPRVDPRRAAASATITSSGAAQNPPLPAGNPQQNVEIRMLLQKSEWYKNLNSKYKIMVNQQLALVSTELKRFHQDPSPNKVFDIQFILNNQNLQQILSNLGIFIDDDGQVTHIDSDNDMMGGMGSAMDYGSNQMIMNDPSMSMQQRMQMQQQMGFLRRPPPNMNMMNVGGNGPIGGPSGAGGGMFSGGGGGGGGGMMAPYGRNARTGLLGMQPNNNNNNNNNSNSGGNFNNPFGGNPGDNGGGNMMDQNFCGPSNPFSNNYGANGGGGNFGGQQMGRGNRSNFNRSGGGMNNRQNQNRRAYKSNNSRDRRGGGGGGGGGGGAGGGMGGAGPNDDMEDNWDNNM